jgi:hypothetical protein
MRARLRSALNRWLAHLREERRRLKEEECSRARKAAWESFMRKERRELKLRKEGQLAGLLGEALAGELPAALRRLALEDQRQAEEELVALTSNGKRYYKLLEELTEGDMGARIALLGCGRRSSRSRRTGGSITGEAPEGKAACSQVLPVELQPVPERLGVPRSYAYARM